MGWNEKCIRWQYATMPTYFNKNIWTSLFGKEYFSKSMFSMFKMVIGLMILCEPSFYCMLKAIGMKKNFMAFAYMGIIGAIFYIAPEIYYKWLRIEKRANRYFWLLSQKPYLMNLIWAKYWDKKMAQIKF